MELELESPAKNEGQSTTTVESLVCETPNIPQDEAKPQTEKKSLAFMLAFASIMASNFISIMDTVIVATALPAIAHGLKAKSNEAYWLGSGFLFAQAVSQPLYGTMSSVFGRKPCFVFGMALFTVASVFCATAQSVGWLITARVVSRNFILAVLFVAKLYSWGRGGGALLFQSSNKIFGIK